MLLNLFRYCRAPTIGTFKYGDINIIALNKPFKVELYGLDKDFNLLLILPRSNSSLQENFMWFEKNDNNEIWGIDVHGSFVKIY